MKLGEQDRKTAVDFFYDVQARLSKALAEVEGQSEFTLQPWEFKEKGGGTIGLFRGECVEKAGVNVSVVSGDSYPSTESEFAGKPFSAAGVSTIAHMKNPYAPIGHMNVRLIEVNDGEDFWFGGGADLTPFIAFDEDTKEFHEALREACRLHPDPEAYEKFSKWCDEYFYIPHRKSVRGVGGTFFDFQKASFDKLFPFVQATANAYVKVFPEILKRRKDTPYTEEEKEGQLYWRGRYAEYNLIYDRGTKFGLLSGGNPDAIFVSLPPVVKW